MTENSSSRRGRKSRTAIYQQLEEAVADLRARLGGLPRPVEAQDIWGDIWFREAHNSTAIEGNTLVLREVEVLLREGRAVGDKALADYLEVTGYAEAAQWVYGQALEPGGWTTGSVLSLAEMRYIHRLALTPVWEVAPHPLATPDETPGNFRRHNIETFGGGMVPPPWTEVSAHVHTWLQTLQEIDERSLPFSEAIAAIHHRFEQIHPFLDGNGRTGRLLLNLVLIRQGYPPAIIEKRQRTRYLDALRKADAGDLGPLGELIARAILDSLYRFIVPAMAGPVQLVPLAALADNELTWNALYQAVIRGRLRARQDESGRWFSSRLWLDEYKRSRSSRGRKSRVQRDPGR